MQPRKLHNDEEPARNLKEMVQDALLTGGTQNVGANFLLVQWAGSYSEKRYSCSPLTTLWTSPSS
ncbi:hypothetical protein HanRHA438_Chr08g0359031 [Helianthus annuus]|nr:hypothetical protein HanHA89_Chr08g0304591 [Helianthus annuus]KAJ0719767.1 hypothetical protein HanLR1_Chr08g0285441 [Helianthus annuus]KAJ0722993.1 hypothetical protein HanOQP8_Chr08g0292951 [Helianthus annuus]KAJ0898631.1 hypothetical protein HanRHA438_Chr08g0359031 [Helianthus annuus]KAJ0902283.1 hypothetical protein HanPSC8_Chr08g0335211 [Helianthus annuus]